MMLAIKAAQAITAEALTVTNKPIEAYIAMRIATIVMRESLKRNGVNEAEIIKIDAELDQKITRRLREQ